MTRIGLFGGTFDPPHNAHVALASLAVRELALDELRWIPAGRPWQKSRVITPAVHREAMVQLAMGDEPRFVLERCEILREGPSYTLDTVRELQAARPHAEWYLIIGHDQYAALHTWRDWRELLGRVTLAVANRPGVLAEPHADVKAFAHRAVPLPMLDIASTDIRTRVASGQDISTLVPADVARYIEAHHLYHALRG
ncbi:nicotinate-nucleotide adenylyltransferase [uncultured Piscinibacter sp.]|uniref:nicotinate-nucleotide adenylyltransferase n=1 Tax=uncultured Piscinibacter sp. TaxID=1131835 RepID=UPI00263657D9|nr:nicotinate-nucleotide adenylyltransferase [uncultured Piscinibacter sp.]